MAHSYDFVLQAAAPGAPPPIPALVAALTERGATLSPEGHGTWKLPEGELSVTVIKENGVDSALDVRVPMKDTTHLIEAVCKALVDVAQAAQARVTDPQRNDVVTLTNTAGVVDEYLRMARYAGEYGGVSDALGLSSYAQPSDETSTTMRWLLMLVVFVGALYGAWKIVTTIQESAFTPDEPPADVNVPPKVPGK